MVRTMRLASERRSVASSIADESSTSFWLAFDMLAGSEARRSVALQISMSTVPTAKTTEHTRSGALLPVRLCCWVWRFVVWGMGDGGGGRDGLSLALPGETEKRLRALRLDDGVEPGRYRSSGPGTGQRQHQTQTQPQHGWV